AVEISPEAGGKAGFLQDPVVRQQTGKRLVQGQRLQLHPAVAAELTTRVAVDVETQHHGGGSRAGAKLQRGTVALTRIQDRQEQGVKNKTGALRKLQLQRGLHEADGGRLQQQIQQDLTHAPIARREPLQLPAAVVPLQQLQIHA